MSDLKSPNYKPANLLDHVAEKVGATNDAQLAAKLEIPPSRISMFRNAVVAISDGVLIRMNEVAGFAIGDMRELMGLSRRKYIRG